MKKRLERDRDDPKYVITTYEGLHNHLCLGRFNDEFIACKKGLEFDPDDEALKSGLADAEYAASRSRAEPERKALARKEKELGNSAFGMKDFDAAIAHYTKAMEFNDEDISYLLNRALA